MTIVGVFIQLWWLQNFSVFKTGLKKLNFEEVSLQLFIKVSLYKNLDLTRT